MISNSVSIQPLKYTDVVWNDFEAAFTDDKYLVFILQIKNEIGSGTGFGSGPLFQLGNEKIQNMCLNHPNDVPVRIAEMMPIYDGNIWECNSFSEIMQWILDSYGNLPMVQLLNHKFSEVREWAAKCIQEFD